MGRRGTGRTLLALAIVLTLAACSGGSSASPSTGSTPAGSATAPSVAPGGSGSPGAGDLPGPLAYDGAVRFGVFPNITHAPGLIALADGGPLSTLLPNAKLEVKSFNSGTTAVEAIFNGGLDITYIGPNPAINAFAQSNGEAVRVISGSTSGGAFLVVKPEIASAQDLRGKKIATPSLGNTQDVALRAWLKGQGLATDKAGGGDVSVVPQENAQTLETFQAGTIDGAWVPEPWATRLIDEGGAKVLVDERDLWPNGQYVTTHLLVATRFLADHPDVVSRILLANIQAVDAIESSAEEAQGTVNAQIEAFTTRKLPAEVLEKAWPNLTFTVDPIASSLQKSADDAQSLDLLKDPGDLKGLYDLTLLNELLRALGQPEVAGPA